MDNISEALKQYNDKIDPAVSRLSIILAAGHGKRIKSEKSKMLHEIWGKPSVWRVCNSAKNGLDSENQIIVVGIKAVEVAQALGKHKNRVFVYQNKQNGTGDAVRVALEYKGIARYKGDVYIFPGDMGLLSVQTVADFVRFYQSSGCDMLVMTGTYEGNPENNYYGRIIKSRHNSNEVIEIKEHKDILAMNPDQPYRTIYKGKEEEFTKNELLNIREFNTGVYVFKIDSLKKFISQLKPDNVQGEIYITDLIKIFNDSGLRVCSSGVTNNNLVIAFNVKSVLKRMEETYREIVYERLKDIITIDDSDDFFIAEETIDRILHLDKKHRALEIKIGKGAYIGSDVEVKRGLHVGRNAILKGHIRVGENVRIDEASMFSTFPGQTIDIGENSHIFRGNVIQGSVKIGKNVRVETGVRITGSSEEPVIIGDNVQIKGMTYIFGSTIEDNLLIEHSILKNKRVEKVIKKDGEVQPIKYILPHPEGLDSISNLNKDK